MRLHTRLTVLLASSILLPLRAQNELRHLDQVAWADRGGIPQAASATFLQRIPADQAGGAQAITGFSAVLQCQGATTAQLFFYELRANNPAGPATGAPDTAGGALATAGPFTFPASTSVTALQFTITFSTPIAVAPRPPRVPVADLYSAVVLPAPVPGNAALYMHMNTPEAMRPGAVGYTGTAGVAGLAWSVVTGLANPTVLGANGAWALGMRFADDVCQPFAWRSGRANFGYLGLFPDTAAGDAPGWRVRATASVGSPSVLVLAAGLLPAPAAIPGIGGLLSLDPSTGLLPMALAFTATAVGLPVGTTEALFGPFPTNLAGGIHVYAQAITFDTATTTPRLSTACRVNF